MIDKLINKNNKLMEFAIRKSFSLWFLKINFKIVATRIAFKIFPKKAISIFWSKVSKGNLTISITYWLTTKDSNLAGGYFRVKNNAEKTISNMTLEAGKNYSINVLVGMSEIQFNSNVAEWETTITE